MSKRYPGNYITGNPVALSQSSNSGVWDLKDQYQATGNNTWQETDGIYEIGGSLMFRRAQTNAYLTKTFPTAGNGKTFTISTWVKRTALGVRQAIFTACDSSGGVSYWGLDFGPSDTLYLYDTNAAGGTSFETSSVYRDVSAWYHIVIALDYTQSVPSNRIKLYVNGSQVTRFASLVYPAQNSTATIYTAGGGAATIGTWGPPFNSPTLHCFDGCISEFNFIDGQQLDPSYFGYTNSITNIWQPKQYTGTYGLTGFYLPLSGTSYCLPNGYFAAFNGTSQRLTVPHNTALDLSSGNFTIEIFIFHRDGGTVVEFLSKGAGYQIYNNGGTIFSAMTSTNSAGSYFINAGFGTLLPNDWNHVVLQRVGNNYYGGLNGTWTLIGTSASGPNGGTDLLSIGAYFDNTYKISGNLSNVRIVKGTAVYPTSGLGYLVPTENLSNIPGTQLLTLQNPTIVDNSANNFTITNVGSVVTTANPYIGVFAYDKSGNLGAWKNNGGFDGTSLVVDSPTNIFTQATDVGGVVPGNYATLNTLNKGNATVAYGGNWVYSGAVATGWGTAMSTIAIPRTGKWYCEGTISSLTAAGTSFLAGVGIVDTRYLASNAGGGYGGEVSTGYTLLGGLSSPIHKFNSGSGTAISGGTGIVNGDVLSAAFDADTGKLWFAKNGAWVEGSPITETTPSFTVSTSLQYYFNAASFFTTGYTAAVTMNFGQSPFKYAPPIGYKSLNTTNMQALGDATVGRAAIQSNKWMDASLWGGTGTSVKVTNSGFQPDLVWNKSRSVTENHVLNDSVRGAGQTLYSNLTNNEAYDPGVTAFNTDGFNSYGSNGYSYVSWQWKQSPTSGFNIIPYTGTGANQTITHNLGVVPSMIITKNRTGTAGDWAVWHTSMGDNFMRLNTTAAAIGSTSNGVFNVGSITSSVIAVGVSSLANQSSASMIAYVWAEVPGFSKFGSYVGNGSADGPFIYTGFRPAFILVKRSNGIEEWVIIDNKRDIDNNGAELRSFPNSNATDSSAAFADFLSNGFKMTRSSGGTGNVSGNTYIYMAFAESPFGLNNRAR